MFVFNFFGHKQLRIEANFLIQILQTTQETAFKFINNLGKPLVDGISSQIRRALATGGAEAAQEAAFQRVLLAMIGKGEKGSEKDEPTKDHAET